MSRTLVNYLKEGPLPNERDNDRVRARRKAYHDWVMNSFGKHYVRAHDRVVDIKSKFMSCLDSVKNLYFSLVGKNG